MSVFRSSLVAVLLLATTLVTVHAQQSNISYVGLDPCCIAADGQGNNFIVSTSPFPTGYLAFSEFPSQATTISVVKTDPGGNLISQFSFAAGSDGQAAAAAVDPEGNLWIAGSIAVSSQSYPTLGFIAKVDSSGTHLLYSGTFGGLDTVGSTSINAIAFDPAGNAYLAGSTSQTDFPVTAGAFISAIDTAPAYVPKGFVSKLTPASQQNPPYTVAYSTLLGGQPSGTSLVSTYASALVVDSSGVVTVAGNTYASDFPVTPGAFQTQFQGAYADGFITRLNAQGTGLIWSTLLGETAPAGIALDSGGNVVVAGTTSDPGFPVTAGAIQPQLAQATFNVFDGFVTKLNSNGASLLFSTYYGIVNAPPKLRLDAQGDVWITESLADPKGFVLGPNPVAVGDGVIAELAPDGSSVLFSELVPNGMAGQDLALNPDGSLTVIGPPQDVAFNAAVSTGFILRQPRATPTGVSILGVADSASNEANDVVAPGEFISIYGNGLGPAEGVGMQIDSNGRVASSLGGTQVSFDGTLAPLFYAAENQINVLVPYEVAPGTQVNMTITTGSGSSQTLPLQVAAAQPNIMAVLNSDGSLNSSSHPASPGDTITILVSGAGTLVPQLADGAIAASPAPAPALKVQTEFTFTVFAFCLADCPINNGIGVMTAAPAYAGGVSGTVIDMLRVDVQVPATLYQAGPPPFGVAIMVGNSTSPTLPFYLVAQS
jgi:uncharacterized protein (TIGR03437 family)